MTIVRLAAVALAGLALVGAGPPPETRSLFTVKEFPAFQVMVPSESSAWCSETARVSIIGQSADQFSQNQPVIERIVGGLRAIMSFECPQATKIAIAGKVQGQPIYQASASAAGGWKLEGVALRSADQMRMLADLETVSRCDEVASGPGDPEAMSEGVSDDDLEASDAVQACGKAIALDGETPRFRYQLARGLLKEGKSEEAIEQLVPAGEAGHGGALALLGDVYLNGAAGIEPDPATAKELYERAAEAGFTPARTVLAKFEDQTKEAAQADAEEKAEAVQLARAEREETAPAPVRQSSARGINTQGYEFPDLIQAVYTGNFDSLGNERGTKIYLLNMAEGFRNVCRGSFTINEMNQLRSAAMDKSDFTVAAGGGALYDLAAQMATIVQNPGAMMQMAQNAQAAETQPQQAGNDAMLFLERNNCGSAAFTKFTQNLRSYVSDQSTPANMTAIEYKNACMAGARPTHYAKDDFCMCFVARANSAGLSRTEKKGLLNNFWPTATAIMNQQSEHFGACNGAFAR